MSLPEQVLRRLGFEFRRFRASPYEMLPCKERFKETTVDLLGAEFRVPDCLSFYHSYRELFYDEIYRFECCKERPHIIDCGSNCGVSVVYFKSLYPDSVITAIEADAQIFEMLRWNVGRQGLEDVKLIHGALSVRTGPVEFYSEGSDCGRSDPIEGATPVMVAGITLDEILNEPVDMLKIDIEGAESEVLLDATRLGRADRIFVEYHSFPNKEQGLGAILQKLSSEGFRYHIHSQFGSGRPFVEHRLQLGMEMQLNIFAMKVD